MDPLAPLTRALHAEGRPRVWSLVITVFGDAVEPRGGRIATARLRALLERVGVGEGAMRTALSRLSSDGWVHSERHGRASFYRLTPRGQQEAAAATQRIFRAPQVTPDSSLWSLGQGGTPPATALALGDGWWLAEGAAEDHGALLTVTGALRAGPDLAKRIVSEPHLQALRAMRADLRAMDALIARKAPPPDALTMAAARMLLVHRWRRIVLRFPELPDAILPSDHPGHRLRADIAQMYRHLSPLTEMWLDTAADADVGGYDAMPPADTRAADRFAPREVTSTAGTGTHAAT